MNDYRIKIQVKNNRLLERREKLKLTQPDLARFADVGVAAYRDLEAMRVGPIARHGEWSKTAAGVADFFGVAPEELWPEHMQRAIDSLELRTNVAPIALPPDPVEVKQLGEAVSAALETLTPREQLIVQLRHGLEEGGNGEERTFADVAAMAMRERGGIGISTQRAIQIYDRAMRKLRHPSRAKRLRIVGEFAPERRRDGTGEVRALTAALGEERAELPDSDIASDEG